MHQTTIIFCTLAAIALCAPENVPDHTAGANLDPLHVQEVPGPSDDHEINKRSPGYNFGLGKRAYSYVSEYKRLPVYNFGLGKRSPAYSFGLGKRAGEAGEAVDLDPEERQLLLELLDRYQLEDDVNEEKRAKQYSFGLGKRFDDLDSADQEKRARMYEFGLGKRTPYYNFGLGKRQPSRTYSFGLGKRLSPGKFNFGLGKRERAPDRFSFGLGKRSLDVSEENDEETA